MGHVLDRGHAEGIGHQTPYRHSKQGYPHVIEVSTTEGIRMRTNIIRTLLRFGLCEPKSSPQAASECGDGLSASRFMSSRPRRSNCHTTSISPAPRALRQCSSSMRERRSFRSPLLHRLHGTRPAEAHRAASPDAVPLWKPERSRFAASLTHPGHRKLDENLHLIIDARIVSNVIF